MGAFSRGPVSLSPAALSGARALFASHRVDDEATLACIAQVDADCEYLLDPHSAIGYAAARQIRLPQDIPRITLATAHPAKFPDAIARALPGRSPGLPAHLADLHERHERYSVHPNELEAVQRAMADALGRAD
jgi:threonine synthase